MLGLFCVLVYVQGHRRSQSIHPHQQSSSLSSTYHIPVCLSQDDEYDKGVEPYANLKRYQTVHHCSNSSIIGYSDGFFFRKHIMLASITKTRTHERLRRHPILDSTTLLDEENILTPSKPQNLQYNDDSSIDEEGSTKTSPYVSFPLVSKSLWDQFNGREFYHPSARVALAQTGITMAKDLFRAATSIVQRIPSTPTNRIHSSSSSLLNEDEIHILWKPDSKTKLLLQQQNDSPSKPILSDALQLYDSQGQEKEGHIFVWVGQFQSKTQGLLQEYQGGENPIIRTTSIVPFSPKALTMLLLDSHRVREYNKMSIGRTDEVIFTNHHLQEEEGEEAKDTKSTVTKGSSLLFKKSTLPPPTKMMKWNHYNKKEQEESTHSNPTTTKNFPGVAKIVRNLTQPPLSSKVLEFITFMYARPLQIQDDVGPGFSSLLCRHDKQNIQAIQRTSASLSSHPTKAVKLSSSTISTEYSSSLGYVVVSRAVPTSKELDTSSNTSHRQRSEILLNVNLLRAVPGNPHQTEMTTISHVNVPSVPLMVATPVGIKGAIDFVKDLRALGGTI